jgi:hypothetical protein
MLKRIGVLAMILTAGAAVLPAVAQAQEVRYRGYDRDRYGYYTMPYAGSYRENAWHSREYRERLERERRWERSHRREYRHDRDFRHDWDRR